MDADKPGVEALAKDFRRWGKTATRRIQRMVKQYGVIFHEFALDGKG